MLVGVAVGRQCDLRALPAAWEARPAIARQ
jgi:hypothetical protein